MSDNLLQMQNGHKQYGSKVLFEEASFSLNQDEHVGVIGPNGAGKSTLFKILIKQEELDSGKIIVSKGLKIAYLSQQDIWADDETAETYFEKICSMPQWELEQLAPSLGLNSEHLTVPILSLSGGYRMRIKILALVGQEPDLMLLDEPTNYLDLETTLVLERFLQAYEKAFLLISHDREFLKRTTDMTLEVEAGEITKYPGNIDDYFEQKALLRSQLEAQAMSQAAKRKTILDFVARFGAKATKAKQAQSRLKSLSRMEKIELKEIPIRASIRIPDPLRVSRLMLTLKNAVFGYDKRPIVQPVDLFVSKGERLAVVGFNGAGKSTLLKGIAGSLTPMTGTLEYGFEVNVSYFAQHVAEALKPNLTVFESLDEVAGHDVPPQVIRDLAGSLLFSGDAISKKISVLSGGEKTRVALGQVLLKRASILILDEPTNHLDFDTVEALVRALQNFPGTVVFVSHDRGFVSRVATKLLCVEKTDPKKPANAYVYLNSYDQYLYETSLKVFSEEAPKKKADKSHLLAPVAENVVEFSQPHEKDFQDFKKPNLSKSGRERKLKQCETRIANIQSEMDVISKELASHDISLDEKNSRFQKWSDLQVELQHREEEWLTLQE